MGTDSKFRAGPPDAEIALFTKGGRDIRLEKLDRGEEAPREFFYGYRELAGVGVSASLMSSAGALNGVTGATADFVERVFVHLTRLGVRPLSARLRARDVGPAKVVISYTDGFSLSLGLGLGRKARRPVLIGGFHALSDLEERVPERLRPMARRIMRRALGGLDHAFFFGPADRTVAIDRYGLSAARSSVIRFGIDTDFWRPLPDEPQADFVVAVGQDPNRDYDLLASAPGSHPIRIITRGKVRIPPGSTHVRTDVGDFFGSDSMSDEDLRRLYNAARAVIVPLKDVYQPSGYSVTLQAMSCGRCVILTRTRGLWAPDLLRDGENCLLVPPNDAAALGAALGRVRSDPALAVRIGAAARETVLRHFALHTIAHDTKALAERGLKIHREREQAAR